ncbi:MAG: amino acid permease [Candidatus Nanopelagicales bacterium]
MTNTSREATQVLDLIIQDAEENKYGLKRTIGGFSLTALGVAAVVGAGIFVVTGHAAAEHAGPAVFISFIIAAIVATFAALCYAELAAMIPLSGSTYSYAYASMGTLIAWIIGWDLLVEYLFGAANVANGWSGYFTDVLHQAGINIPEALTTAPVGTDNPGIVNLPAVVLVLVLTGLLLFGVSETAKTTTLFVAIKLITLAIFVGFGIFAVTRENYVPLIPANEGSFGAFGWTGIIAAAGTVFYAYISFDAVCTAAQEVKDPAKNLPRGILGSLGIATGIYVLVGIVLVGLVPYAVLNTSNPLSTALEGADLTRIGMIVDIGAVIGLAASVLALLYGQTRIMMRMSEDRMFPAAVGKASAKRGTPTMAILICGTFAAILAGVLPLSILTEMISIGTLLAFVIVSIAVIVLRKTRPDIERPFKVPFGPVIPILAIITSLIVMFTLPGETWLRLGIWLLIGLGVYYAYSRKHSKAKLDERFSRATGHAPDEISPSE